MSFTNFIQLQNDVAHALLCDNWFESVNVVTRDTLLLEQTRMADQTYAAETLVYTTSRNGRSGCGVIVEKPEFSLLHENVPGPQADLILTCTVIEDRLQNEDAQFGTLRAADQVAQKILDVLHLWSIQGQGIFRGDRTAIVSDPRFEPLTAYRVRLRMTCNRGQTSRCATPSITNTEGTITLATSTSGADIYYTTDGTFPAPSNPKAIIYSGAFTPNSGETARAAAVKTDLSISSINQLTI